LKIVIFYKEKQVHSTNLTSLDAVDKWRPVCIDQYATHAQCSIISFRLLLPRRPLLPHPPLRIYMYTHMYNTYEYVHVYIKL